MTLFVVDASHYQTGLPIGSLREQGFAGLIVKATDGRSYTDPQFARSLAQARQAGLLVAAYHFLHSGNLAEQAAHTASVVPADVPVWIDVEGGPTRDDAYGYAAALRAAGGRVGGIYTASQPASGFGGWWRAAYYSDPSGTAERTYAVQGGDTGPGWTTPHGGDPDLWQYCQHGRIAGYSGDVDFSAYRGTLQQLASSGWFWVPPDLQGDEMPLTDADLAAVEDRVWHALTQRQFTSADEVDPDLRGRGLASLLLVDARSVEVIRDAIGLLTGRTAQTGAQLAQVAQGLDALAHAVGAGVVDTTALAQAIADHIPDSIATEVADKLAARLAS